MWGCHTPTLFYATPPPLSLWRKISGSKWHEKHPGFYRVNLPPKTGLPGRSNSRQSSRWNQGCFFPYQDTTISDIFITSKMCFCFTKTLARGTPLDP